MVTYNFSNTRVYILIGNIVDQECDAIVNSANVYLQKGSGVCGAIFQGAGSELKSVCDEKIRLLGRNLTVSEAVVTAGFNLSANYIIHSVSPRCMFRWDDSIKEKITTTYRNIYAIADDLGLKSVAIPAMGVGHHHCDLLKCTKIAIDELFHYLLNPNKRIEEIRLVLYTEEMALQYIEIFKELLSKQT